MIAGEPMGDAPQTQLGRLFTLVIMLGGLTVFALFTGTVSAIITERLRSGMNSRLQDIEELEGHIVVCGWSRAGRKVVEELCQHGRANTPIVLVVAEVPPDFILEAADRLPIRFLQGDYTKTDVLEQARVRHASRTILLADRSLPNRSDQDRDARTILATSARVSGVVEIADEIFSSRSGNQFYKRPVREQWRGKTFLEIQSLLKGEFDALLGAVEQPSAPLGKPNGDRQSPYMRTTTNPPADYTLQSGNLFIVVAKSQPVW